MFYSVFRVTCQRKIVSVRRWWLPQSFTFLWQSHRIMSEFLDLLTSRETLIAFHVSAELKIDFQRLKKNLLLGKTHHSLTTFPEVADPDTDVAWKKVSFLVSCQTCCHIMTRHNSRPSFQKCADIWLLKKITSDQIRLKSVTTTKWDWVTRFFTDKARN